MQSLMNSIQNLYAATLYSFVVNGEDLTCDRDLVSR